jgi:protein-L-isoaspartate(D-aspartate) O-methyltransferase
MQTKALPMDVERARFNMIEQQIRPWDVLDPKVLNLLRDFPREDFVPDQYKALAFVDMNIPLDHEQIMMQPKMEARLLQELSLTNRDKVLEIGTGSGYLTGLLASLAHSVDTVDIFSDFLETARTKLSAHDLSNINYFEGDAAQGWDGEGPYDAIIITGSIPTLPESYKMNLSLNGRLIAVIGQAPVMEAVLLQRLEENSWQEVPLFETSLPPLVNAEPPSRFVF